MSNPLFNQFGNQQAGMNGMIQRFRQFQQMFHGDPKQKVQELLNSGKITQQQYNQAVQMAQQLQRMIPR